MQIEGWTGLVAALIAGAINGSVLVPMKLVKHWAWENTWLIFAVCAYVMSPWIVACYSIPHLAAVYERTDYCYGCHLPSRHGMGRCRGPVWSRRRYGGDVHQFSYFLDGCSVAIGSIGALARIDRSRLLTPGGLKILVWDLVLLLGVLFCAQAGRTKEPASTLGGARTRRGVIVSLLAGLLSTLFNIVLAYGDPIRQNAVSLGADPNAATNAIWSLAVTSGAVPSVIWSISIAEPQLDLETLLESPVFRQSARLRRHGRLLDRRHSTLWVRDHALRQIRSGIGLAYLHVGHDSSGISWGLLLGEWRGAPRPAVRLLWTGVGTQIFAIVLLSGG